MGVPFFVSFLRERGYAGVLMYGKPAIVHTLSIDMNQIFHTAAQETYGYGDKEYDNPKRRELVQRSVPRNIEMEFFNNIGTRLLNIIVAVEPVDAVIFCVDGLAPFAKMQQQRQRRYRSKVKTEEELRFATEGPPSIFDSNSITPGTDFMIRLDLFLQGWMETNRMSMPPRVRYSSHLIPGEGEHKIFDMIRVSLDPETPENDPMKNLYNPEGVHMIYGLDADLIMLSVLCPLEHVQLMRLDVKEILNIENLRTGIENDLESKTAIPDFILMMYLLGNDFLPSHPGFENFAVSLDQLFEVYRAVNLPLTNGDDVDFKNLQAFFEKVKDIEPALLQQVFEQAFVHPSKVMALSKDKATGKLDFNKFRSNWYINELGIQGDKTFVNTVWTKLGIPEDYRSIDGNEIVDMCESYLQGLAWIFLYYRQGPYSVNTKFIYPFFHSPLIVDLYEVLSQSEAINLKNVIPSSNWEFTVLHQLIIVIPPQSLKVVPKEIRSLYDIDSPIADIFTTKFIIEKDNKDIPRLFLSRVPPVNPYRIFSAIDSLNLSPEFLYKYTTDQLYVIDAIESATRYNEQKAQRKLIEQIVYGRSRGRGERSRGRGKVRGRISGRKEGERKEGERKEGEEFKEETEGEEIKEGKPKIVQKYVPKIKSSEAPVSASTETTEPEKIPVERVSSERGRGRGFTERGRGRGSTERGRGFTERGRGRGFTERGRGRGSTERGRGERGRGSTERGRGRGRLTSERGTPIRGRGETVRGRIKPQWGSLRFLL